MDWKRVLGGVSSHVQAIKRIRLLLRLFNEINNTWLDSNSRKYGPNLPLLVSVELYEVVLLVN